MNFTYLSEYLKSELHPTTKTIFSAILVMEIFPLSFEKSSKFSGLMGILRFSSVENPIFMVKSLDNPTYKYVLMYLSKYLFNRFPFSIV